MGVNGTEQKTPKRYKKAELYLSAKHPFTDLPQKQLPSSGDILRYYQFIIHDSKVKCKPTSINVGCKLKSKS